MNKLIARVIHCMAREMNCSLRCRSWTDYSIWKFERIEFENLHEFTTETTRCIFYVYATKMLLCAQSEWTTLQCWLQRPILYPMSLSPCKQKWFGNLLTTNDAIHRSPAKGMFVTDACKLHTCMVYRVPSAKWPSYRPMRQLKKVHINFQRTSVIMVSTHVL